MQYDYDIEGLNLLGNHDVETSPLPPDFDQDGAVTRQRISTQADGVFAGANGDGYLVYPGAKYGHGYARPADHAADGNSGTDSRTTSTSTCWKTK